MLLPELIKASKAARIEMHSLDINKKQSRLHRSEVACEEYLRMAHDCIGLCP